MRSRPSAVRPFPFPGLSDVLCCRRSVSSLVCCFLFSTGLLSFLALRLAFLPSLRSSVLLPFFLRPLTAYLRPCGFFKF